MAIVVEDGSGKADAESYIDVTYADDYHAARNNPAWALLTTAVKEASLRKATEYMLGEYRPRWKGYRAHLDQALDWPRTGVFITDAGGFYGADEILNTVIPEEVKRACAELAIRASKKALVIDETQRVIAKAVGPISVKYDSSSPLQVQYEQIDKMLKPYLSEVSRGIFARLVRT